MFKVKTSSTVLFCEMCFRVIKIKHVPVIKNGRRTRRIIFLHFVSFERKHFFILIENFHVEGLKTRKISSDWSLTPFRTTRARTNTSTKSSHSPETGLRHPATLR